MIELLVAAIYRSNGVIPALAVDSGKFACCVQCAGHQPVDFISETLGVLIIALNGHRHTDFIIIDLLSLSDLESHSIVGVRVGRRCIHRT